MKKYLIWVLCATFVTLVSCLPTKQQVFFWDDPQPYIPTHTNDSVAYFLGVDLGFHVLSMDEKMKEDGLHGLDARIIARAIKEVLDNPQKFSKERAVGYLDDYFNVRLPKEKLQESENYISDALLANPNLSKTESGLVYEIIEAGDMTIRAKRDLDEVTVKYVGRFTNGTIFDENDNATFAINRIIKGWTEGIKLVGKGGKIKLILHPDLAYGEQGAGSILPNTLLIFDIELLDVIPYKYK